MNKFPVDNFSGININQLFILESKIMLKTVEIKPVSVNLAKIQMDCCVLSMNKFKKKRNDSPCGGKSFWTNYGGQKSS